MHKRNIHVQKGKVPSPYGEGWMHMNVPLHVCVCVYMHTYIYASARAHTHIERPLTMCKPSYPLNKNIASKVPPHP